MTLSPPLRARLLFGLLVLLTALVYASGLHGGFVYDDWGSITGNSNVQIAHGEWAEWMRAALSYPSGTPPFRSLTMLSFAANYWLSGLDPFAYKLTNLILHLGNGYLLYWLLGALFELRRACMGGKSEYDERLAAAVIAGLWLLLPINLTAVLYVVQRLESLATTFVFLGLGWYLRARLLEWQGRGQHWNAWLALGLCTAAGLLAKETAIMLPFYAALAEFCLCRARNADGRLSGNTIALYVCTLLLPMLVGLAWLWGRYIDAASLATMDSDTITRLLTEARIMFDYMAWTLLPNLDVLTLYHDDITRSHGLLSPPTTLAAIAGIGLLVGLGLWQRRKRPLFALGIAWFFAGHLLTGTVIPLMLAFEHRNYFSSVGLLLSAASLIRLEANLRNPRLAAVIACVAVAWYATTTGLRAAEWSDPLRLAASDAIKRPQSPNAQYDYAQALLIRSMQHQDQAAAQAALKVLQEKRSLPGAGIHFEQSIVTLLGESGYATPADVWDSMIAKLKANAPDTNEIHALSRLNHCFSDQKCKASDLPKFQAAWAAALSHPASNGLLSTHGEYAWHVANDREAAERDYREVFRRSPNDIEAEVNLIVVLIHEGKRTEAESMIAAMEKRNRLGMLDGFIKPLRRTLESVVVAPESTPSPDNQAHTKATTTPKN